MIALLLATAVTCIPPASQELVGFWETRSTSMGGIGAALELGADGSATSITTVIVGFRYELQGDRLFVRAQDDPPNGVPTASRVQFEGDAFVQTTSEGAEVRRVRVGRAAPGAAPIVGVWRLAPGTGPEVFERYDADGSMQFRMPMRGSRGCYSIDEHRLVLEFESQKQKHYQFVVEGEELLLTAPNRNEPERLVRVRGGAWYATEAEPGR